MKKWSKRRTSPPCFLMGCKLMAKYSITFIETNVLTYEVDAKDEGEAWEKWEDDVNNGRIDFTDMEPIDSEIYINEL